jgi:hypothetical protein
LSSLHLLRKQMATARITLTGRQFRPDDLSAGQLPGGPPDGQLGHEVPPVSSAARQRAALFQRHLVPDEIRTHPAERETVTVNRERACGTALAPVPP